MNTKFPVYGKFIYHKPMMVLEDLRAKIRLRINIIYKLSGEIRSFNKQNNSCVSNKQNNICLHICI